MLYSATSTILVTLASSIALAALWIVVRKSWLVTWMKTTLAFSVVAFAVFLALVGVDLHRYQSYRYNTPVAKIKITQLDQQFYQVALSIINGGSYQYRLRGDLWQLDARLITWKGPLFTFLGATPGYQFERISGRYISLEQETTSQRTAYAIAESWSPFDVFQWLKGKKKLPLIEARYGSATYMPLRNGAEFTVAIGQDGLVARPVNTVAIEAVDNWQ